MTDRLLTIDRVKGRGPLRFVCVPGLVPDGPETFLRQAKLLSRFGTADVVTYPRDRFQLDAALRDLQRLIADDTGEGPVVLIGVSVGGGLCLELLRLAREEGKPLPLAALVLISPLITTADLAGTLKKLLDPIFSEVDKDGGKPEVAVERARKFFKSLASRSAGPAQERQGWRKVAAMFTPAGIAEMADRKIRQRIEATLDHVTPVGAIQRVDSLRELRGLEANERTPLSTAPTLLLWGAKERNTLDMDGPGTRILCRPDLATRHFPKAEVHWIYTADGEEVPHASLLRHAKAFNRPLKRFLKRI